MKATIPITESGAPAGALYFKTDVSPEEVFRAIGRLRREARDEINRLIRFLDDTERHMCVDDEDDEREQETDELSLGFLHMVNQDRHCEGLGADLESEHDGREPQQDDEE